MIRFNCPSCNAAVSAPEDCGGRATRCRQCGNSITVPMLGKFVASRPTVMQAQPVAKMDSATTTESHLSPAPAPSRTKRRIGMLAIMLLGIGALLSIYLVSRVSNRPKGGKAPADPGENGAPAAISIKWKPLSEEQQIRWKQTRRKVKENGRVRIFDPSEADTLFTALNKERADQERKQYVEGRQKEWESFVRECKYQCLAYSGGEAATWQAVNAKHITFISGEDFIGGEEQWNVDGFSADLPREKDLADRVYFQKASLESARTLAQKAAAMPGIQWVSIVDLYSDDDPIVIAWYRDDGDAVKEFKGNPPAKIRDSLKDFVYQLQTKGK